VQKFEKREKKSFGIKIFFRLRKRQKFHAPLLGEFWRSSQDSSVLGYDSEESRDVRQNSAKSGVSNFGKMVVFENEKSWCFGTMDRRVWERGDVLIGTQEMS